MRRHITRALVSLFASAFIFAASVFMAAVAWRKEQSVGPVSRERNGMHGLAYVEPEHFFWGGEEFQVPTGSMDGPDGPMPWVMGQEDAPRIMLRTTTRSFGWPARALEYSVKFYWVRVPNTYYRGTRETEIHNALVVVLPRSGRQVNIPVGVRWRAMAFDLASYAVATYLVATVLAVVRRFVRRRRGRCGACGYDCRGLAPRATCPECNAGGMGSVCSGGG